MAPFKVGSVDVKMRDATKPQTAPAEPRSTMLPAGHKKRPDCRALVSPIIFDQDQILTLRDGTKIRADIFRPVGDEKVPAIVMWGPYGKSGTGLLNLHSMPLRAGIPTDRLSGYEDFEGLDPAEWVPRGYAIVNIDPRGVGDSEGDIRWWGTGEGQDGHDAIEELAKLPWSNGKIGLSGNSWLAISQYFIAAEQPPHLAAIAPLEGLSALFRENVFRGGIPLTTFSRSIADILLGRQQQEDIHAMVDPYTITNDYVEDKRANFSRIQGIPHGNKWLVLHSTQEWYDLYTQDRTQDLDKFFGYYLKDIKNDWPQTSPVRLALLNFTKPPIVNKEFPDLPWQLPSVVSRELYLSPDCKLAAEKPLQSGTLHLQADTADEIAFTTLVIHVSAPEHDDLDIYTHVFKADKEGNILSNLNVPTLDGLPAEEQFKLTKNTVFRYWGPSGILRASRRHVSAEKSGKTWDTLSYEHIEKVQLGEVVKLGIQLWPAGIVFKAGRSWS